VVQLASISEDASDLQKATTEMLMESEQISQQDTHAHASAGKQHSSKQSRARKASSAQNDERNEEEAMSQQDSTYFQEAGSIKRGEHVMIKDQPCRVSEVKSLGKVWTGPCTGCFQVQITARSIFTGRKLERIFPVKENVTMAFIKREEHTVIDIGENGELTLLTPQYETKCDVNLPTGADTDAELADRIREGFDVGKTVVVTVLSACGMEKVTQCKITE
jgi:translation initiation factor 5A